MKPKTVFKIILDVVMLVLFLELMFCYDLSPLFHEVVGIGIGVLFAIHVALNWKPVKAMLHKAREGSLSASRTILLVSDLVLPIGMVTTIVSGMLIATELWLAPGSPAIILLHNVAAYTCLAILATHTVLHARYLAGYVKQMMRGGVLQKAASCVGALALVVTLMGANVFTGLLDSQSSLTSGTAVAATTTSSATTTSDTVSTDSAVTTETTYKGKGRKAQSVTVSEDTTSSSGSDNSSTVSSGSSSNSSTDNSSSTPTNCTQCGRNCPLSSLRCSKGTTWAQEAGLI